MTATPRRIVVLGLSITSSWGNGHATTYRALVRALAARGHDVLFLERDVPWYAAARDLPTPPYGRTVLYHSIDELDARHRDAVRAADLVMVGSYVPEGIAAADWVLATAEGARMFYDIDTPVTLGAVQRGECTYLTRTQIPRYDAYLSFTGGPVLARLERSFGAARARAFYCSFDPESYYPQPARPEWDLGYMGSYSDDRQPALDQLLLRPAARLRQADFVVAGSGYPEALPWPGNVRRIPHLPPAAHRVFYSAQRFTLNVTRTEMAKAGYAPSVRLFEAAACGTAIVTERWDGLDAFFEPQREILVADDEDDVQRVLRDVGEGERSAIGEAARQRVMAEHTPEHRVLELERYLAEVTAGAAQAS